jgi:hypothetical protein
MGLRFLRWGVLAGKEADPGSQAWRVSALSWCQFREQSRVVGLVSCERRLTPEPCRFLFRLAGRQTAAERQAPYRLQIAQALPLRPALRRFWMSADEGTQLEPACPG